MTVLRPKAEFPLHPGLSGVGSREGIAESMSCCFFLGKAEFS